MSSLTSEFNYKRKSHRVTIPMLVDIDGVTYKASDWSMGGCGLKGIERDFQPDDIIDAKCVVPLQDASLTLNIKLQYRSTRGEVKGFSFYELEPKMKRTLRHYLEMAIEGRTDNLEDMVSVATTPGVETPLDEALNLSDLEVDGMRRAFVRRSRLSIGLFLGFFALVLFVLWYNTNYRVESIGITSGNMISLSSPASGMVKNQYVKPGQMVSAGDALLTVGMERMDQAIHDTRLAIKQIQTLLATQDGGSSSEATASSSHQKHRPATAIVNKLSLVGLLRQEADRKYQDLQQAKRLYHARIITKKDLSQLENAHRQVLIQFERESQKFNAANTVHDGSTSLLGSGPLASSVAATQSRLPQGDQRQKLERQLDLLKRDLTSMVTGRAGKPVRSPVDGVIHNVAVIPGVYVQPGDIVALIEVDISPYIVVRMSSREALDIRQGMSGKIYVPGDGNTYAVTVSQIGHSAFNAHTTLTHEASLNDTLIKLTLDDPAVRIAPNRRVEVWIKTFTLF